MGRPREPIDVIVAKNKKHLTKSEIEERKAQEVSTESIQNIESPPGLTKKEKNMFWKYATPLMEIGIFSELDIDMLVRYIKAYELYTNYTKSLMKVSKTMDIKSINAFQKLQDVAFKQCQTCAREMGLSISSRCRLVVPTVKNEEKPVNKFEKFENLN